MRRKTGNKLKLWLFGTMASIMWACGDRPSCVLPENKMVDLMVDMELAEAYVSTGKSASSQERIDIGKQVLASHGVSEETLDTTLAWYGRNMDDYTKLFEKVDKEIQNRQKKYTEIPGLKPKMLDDLWIYGQHITISPLSGYDGLSFSIPNPEVNKGDLIELSFALPNAESLKSTLGVEYADGNGEAIVNNASSKKSIAISLQTDSSKTVSRIFGYLHLKDLNNQPFFIDSIKLVAQSIDTLNYHSQRRSQKTFGPFSPKPIVIIKDTINERADSLTKELESKIVTDSLVNKEISGSKEHQKDTVKEAGKEKQSERKTPLRPSRIQNSSKPSTTTEPTPAKFEKIKKN